jgi:hypothetical protein
MELNYEGKDKISLDVAKVPRITKTFNILELSS